MRADSVVVDASALAALLFGEPAGSDVAARLGNRALFAPSLLRYELASVCSKKGRQEPEKRSLLYRALRLFEGLEVREIQVPPERLVGLAEETGLTTYDAAYLWLALELRVGLVTLDGRLDRAGVEERAED